MKGVLFDLDGVIADTSVYHFQAWRKLIKIHFNLELPDELEKQTKGVSRTDSLKAILKFLNISVSQEQFNEMTTEKNNIFRNLLASLTPANILPGISELISSLKKNNVKLSLASASLNGPFILEKLQLTKAFDAIADPSKVAAGKPAPDIFIAAAEAINLKPQDCVGIEDSIAGITAINKSGALSVGVGSKTDLKDAKLLFPKTAALNYDQIETAWEKFNLN
ncbi:Beta-phosphoglucomutase [Lactobacillus kullabergensis]|uniref:Beta-phosphoglucomutase n=1 Tax=Lactobacillus kullabergensis TaxID=1218493 RepID=A0A0F4LC21_9LACO|nr:beta-phosphoglucomutase [Lactobacillus kullabergensis]KJY55863.1 Beta-phosphoglucomutase [Lactobacillus kullabergensis]